MRSHKYFEDPTLVSSRVMRATQKLHRTHVRTSIIGASLPLKGGREVVLVSNFAFSRSGKTMVAKDIVSQGSISFHILVIHGAEVRSGSSVQHDAGVAVETAI
jgi:hypothetical protein